MSKNHTHHQWLKPLLVIEFSSTFWQQDAVWPIISYNILCGQIIKFGIPSLQPQTVNDLSTAIVSGIKMNTHIDKDL
jgi:hypothetical protein